MNGSRGGQSFSGAFLRLRVCVGALCIGLVGCSSGNEPAMSGNAQPGGSPPAEKSLNGSADVAMRWLLDHPEAHRLENAAEELQLRSVDNVAPNLTLVRFDQHYKTIPLLGQQLRVHLNGRGEVTEISGDFVATSQGMSAKPGTTVEAARAAAAVLVPGVSNNCASCPAELAYLVPQRGNRPLVFGPQLVWQVDAAVNAINGQRLLLHGDSLAQLRSTPLALSGQ